METTTAPKSQINPTSPEWTQYYAKASRIFRSSRRAQRKQLNRKRRRRREQLVMLGSVALIGALVLVFYSVLTR